MKQVKSRYNYDPAQPLSKEYQDAEVFNAYYKCFDTQTNSHYLLSHFKTQNKTQITSLLKKFTTIQTKIQQGLETKYLTQIYDVFLADKDKSLFLVIDFCEGGSIIDYIGKVYTLDPKAAVRILSGALNGLLELHKHDVLNCFINLQNIEIDQNGLPKLSFKCMIYKTIYLSPEFRKQHVKSRQSDLYCMGVCLYRLIHGIFPFKTQKTEELIEMVKKGPLFQIEKEDGIFSITCPKSIRQIIICLLSINPEQRLKAIQKIDGQKLYLQKASQLSPQIYSKFFKSRYINYFNNLDESDSHQFSILDSKEKKLLKLAVYKAANNQIDGYLKNIVTKYAKMSGECFLKIYEYQIIQQEYLAIVFSHYGEGTLADYTKSTQRNFSAQLTQETVRFLKKSLKVLDSPYKFLTNESICLKNGNLKIRFPQFQTRKQQKMIKKLASSGEPHFIAPEILAGQDSKKCDSWSIGVIQYWMIYNELPKLDSKGTLVPNKKQKLSKDKLLYLHNVIEKNPNNRLNVLNQEEVKNRLNTTEEIPGKLQSFVQQQSGQKVRDQQSPQKQSDIKRKEPLTKTATKEKNDPKSSQLEIKQTHTKLYGIGDQTNSEISAKKPEKIKRSKKRDLAPIQVNSGLNPNILPNQIQYEQVTASKYKNPIVIDSKEPLPQKNPNKFSMKMFNEPEEIKTPQKAQTVQKQPTTKEPTNVSILDYFFDYTTKLRIRFASLERNYTKSVRISIKCFITIIIYLFLFYLNFFRTSGSLIGSRQMYEPKVVHIRAFSSDSKPQINYTLVTKTPSQTYQMFYNTTVPVLRDDYKCVLNDYSVKSDVAKVVKSQSFVAYQVFGFLIALLNILIVCVVIARYDICKVCHVTNFDEKKYHTIFNYGMIILSIVTLTSLHYLIYGGLYHLMLEPCLGKSNLPGLQFLMKNWITSWIVRFIWAYLGIAIAYAVIIFFVIKPLKKLHKYFYIGLLVLYFMGVGIRGIGKGYPAHQNVFGVCGQLLGLIISIFLFFTDLMFACFAKPKTQENIQNNIDMRSIEDFNKTEEFFIANQAIEDNYNEK